ncbi:IclR family transcriptional regulator [uncultured Pelagimonas sp.]|uniref:IclR family transcriptional regulator n=1 Tax=uncultured Pelagimonas sp. TaxID=1618102 RepID=UPI002620FE6B|nr:IclR family transcriptional regulator [uncultured Pelagimonas sp.]
MNSQVKPKASADGTVGKALEVLDLVAAKGRPVRFGELLSESPHPKATLYRLVQTLTNQSMLTYDESHQTYAPGLRLVRLAHAAWQQSSLAPIARPFLDDLSREVGETIHLAQLDEGQVLYVDKRNALKPIEMFSAAGKVGPGYCTGVGKAMIAHLDDEAREAAIQRQSFFVHTPGTIANADDFRAELDAIRADGIAFDREEHEPGIICISAPILGSNGRVLGAMSITTSTQLKSLDELTTLRPALTETAQKIAEAAESWQFPA